MIGMPQWGAKVVVNSVALGSPAELSGIEKYDHIAKANGEIIDSATKLQEITNNNLGSELRLEIIRKNETIEYFVLARENPPEGELDTGIPGWSQTFARTVPNAGIQPCRPGPRFSRSSPRVPSTWRGSDRRPGSPRSRTGTGPAGGSQGKNPRTARSAHCPR